jgi:hypothetical protein
VKEHILAARLCHNRYIMIHGEVDLLPTDVSAAAVAFTKQQQTLGTFTKIKTRIYFLFLIATSFFSYLFGSVKGPLQRFGSSGYIQPWKYMLHERDPSLLDS